MRIHFAERQDYHTELRCMMGMVWPILLKEDKLILSVHGVRILMDMRMQLGHLLHAKERLHVGMFRSLVMGDHRTLRSRKQGEVHSSCRLGGIAVQMRQSKNCRSRRTTEPEC